MNYRDITKASTARALTAAALRYDGLRLKEIGARLGGISVERARQLTLKGERILVHRFAALTECAERLARVCEHEFAERYEEYGADRDGNRGVIQRFVDCRKCGEPAP